MRFGLLSRLLKTPRAGQRDADATSRNAAAVAEALKRQGNECLGRGDLEGAAGYYRQALGSQPDYAEALNNLGYVLKEQRRFAEAEAALSRALELDPELGPAQFNRGVLALSRGAFDLAQSCLENAVRLMPGNAEAHSYLANVLHQQGMFEEACDALRTALRLNPDDAESRWVLAMTKIPAMGAIRQSPEGVRKDFLAELDELDRWFHPGRIGDGHLAVGSSQPFYLAYQEVSNKAVLARYGALCNRLMDHWPLLSDRKPAAMSAAGRIRLGFVTHVSNQSVWHPITKGWVRHLDRGNFEVHVFSLDTAHDAQATDARSLADEFVEGKASLDDWVETILSRRIEVLIYPEIGMTAMAAKLANLRLAPVQAVAWGHPETSGLPTIDYYFSAECFEDPDSADNYTEQLVTLPNLGCCYSPLDASPACPDLEALGIDAERPLLLSPGAPFKYAPEFDRVFVDMAKRIGRCRIVFFAEPRKMHLVGQLQSRLRQVFEQAELDFDEYCTFIPFLNRQAFYGLMQRADVFLDTIGFSGFNTAMQAAECGLPIVTREGRFMRGRLASGILKRLGLSELVAASEEQYVSLAARLATDKAYAGSVKRRIEASRHLLFDDLEPVRALEDFLIRTCRSTSEAPDRSAMRRKDQERSPDHVWQLLDTELHMHTLKPGNAPVRLLEMVQGSPRRILDVGCFCGGSGRWLVQKFPGCEIIGIEKMRAAADMAAEVYDRVVTNSIEQMDFAVEGLATSSFDAIIAADVLEHLYNPWQALQRLKPLLAQGGAMYISLPNVRNLGLLNALAGGEWKYSGAGLLDITHIRFFTRRQAVEMLEQTGWRVDELRFSPDPALAASRQDRNLAEVRSIDTGRLTLDNLTPGDVEELFALQFHIRAVPDDA